MAEREAPSDLVERMRANTEKQNRPTRAKPLKRARKKVPKPGRKKA